MTPFVRSPLPTRHERLIIVLDSARIRLPAPMGIRFDVDLPSGAWSEVVPAPHVIAASPSH